MLNTIKDYSPIFVVTAAVAVLMLGAVAIGLSHGHVDINALASALVR